MKRRTLTATLSVIVIILLVALGVYYAKNGSLVPGHVVKDSGSDISDYSAVFLTNGQVYFGKVNSNTSDEVDLTDIYYLQVNSNSSDLQSGTNKNSSSSSADNTNVVLVKLGQELHGPNDQMHINKQQVLFTESLKNNSKVIAAINNYKNK